MCPDVAQIISACQAYVPAGTRACRACGAAARWSFRLVLACGGCGAGYAIAADETLMFARGLALV